MHISLREGDDNTLLRKQFIDFESHIAFYHPPLNHAGNLHPEKQVENERIVAKEKGMDEVFVGVKRRSRVGKILMGPNAQYVILNAPCAVVTVK